MIGSRQTSTSSFSGSSISSLAVTTGILCRPYVLTKWLPQKKTIFIKSSYTSRTLQGHERTGRPHSSPFCQKDAVTPPTTHSPQVVTSVRKATSRSPINWKSEKNKEGKVSTSDRPNLREREEIRSGLWVVSTDTYPRPWTEGSSPVTLTRLMENGRFTVP